MTRSFETKAPPFAESNHFLARRTPSAPHLYLARRTKTGLKLLSIVVECYQNITDNE